MIRPATILIVSLVIYFYYFSVILDCDAVSISLSPKILRTDIYGASRDDPGTPDELRGKAEKVWRKFKYNAKCRLPVVPVTF